MEYADEAGYIRAHFRWQDGFAEDVQRRLFMNVLIDLGYRAEGLIALEWGDVDWDRQTMNGVALSDETFKYLAEWREIVYGVQTKHRLWPQPRIFVQVSLYRFHGDNLSPIPLPWGNAAIYQQMNPLSLEVASGYVEEYKCLQERYQKLVAAPKQQPKAESHAKKSSEPHKKRREPTRLSNTDQEAVRQHVAQRRHRYEAPVNRESKFPPSEIELPPLSSKDRCVPASDTLRAYWGRCEQCGEAYPDEQLKRKSRKSRMRLCPTCRTGTFPVERYPGIRDAYEEYMSACA